MATTPSRALPVPDSLHVEEVVGDARGGSLLVEGDNLPVLEALLPGWAGAAKVVYIDPPYNTGHAHWRYSDRWKAAADPDRHTRWVEFMRPRLTLLREILQDDGMIFVSIDDRALFRLGILLDEIFGEENRLEIIAWEKKYGTQNDARYFSANHEYLLCYAKDRARAKVNLLPRTPEMDERYTNRDDDRRGPWKAGDFSVKTPSPRYMYPITTPAGTVVTPPPGRSWCMPEERYRQLAADNRLWFGTRGNAKPSLKQFLSEVKDGRVPSSLWTYREVGHTDLAKKELKRIMDVSAADFQTPKPTALIKRCIALAAGKDDLIVDAFAGTGTTGQAVLEMNRADAGARRFLLIESGAGDDRFCRDLTAERLRRVITGKLRAETIAGTGGGFTFARVAALASVLPGQRQDR